jgi:hypothetical protein
MINLQTTGRYPAELLSFMLDYNDLRVNYNNNNHDINYLSLTNVWLQASCHPNACRFMNIVTNAAYNEAQAPNLVQGHAAALLVAAAQAEVMQDSRAIWVQYGAHSFVLLTGYNDQIEPLEGWAGNPFGYPFYLSVCRDADTTGVLYDTNTGRPILDADGDIQRTHQGRVGRDEAREALGWLISNNFAERVTGINRLSRAGLGGFGGFHHAHGALVVDQPPELNIRFAPMVDLGTFRTRVAERLNAVGHYRQKAIESQFANYLVCCHCQTKARYFTGNWRECTQCRRHFCPTCKRLLLGHAHRWVRRPGNWLPSFEHGQRACDGPGCGHQTRLMAA